MSAIRVAPREYVDPMTHQPFTPEPPRAHEVYPITRRKATPAELARFSEPVREEPRVSPIRIPQGPPKASESIGLVPRHRKPRKVRVDGPRRSPKPFRRSGGIPKVTDVQVADALRASGGNIRTAAAVLGMSHFGVSSRAATMEKYGAMPADVVALLAPRRKPRRAGL